MSLIPMKTGAYEFEIQGRYAHGWECVNTETTWPAARQSIKEYRENETGTEFRIARVRTTQPEVITS